MEIKTTEIAGLASALTALRLPFGLEERSRIEEQHGWCDILQTSTFGSSVCIDIDKKDLSLMRTLIKRGDEHAKVIRGIVVYAKITAPLYWWTELETYRAGHERLASSSTMHIDCKGLQGEELQNAKKEIPSGKELTKVDFFSYQALRKIAQQRWNHRLPEWHQFLDWVHTLPFAEELIFVDLEERRKREELLPQIISTAKSLCDVCKDAPFADKLTRLLYDWDKTYGE